MEAVDHFQSEETVLMRPYRLGAGILVASFLWMAGYIALITVIMPAKFELIVPDMKVSAVATMAVVGSIVALIANVLFGAFSDLTRSRFGRRNPWLFVGSIGTAVSLLLVAQASTLTTILVWWCFFQFFLNAIVAPLVTIVPDRVPSQRRGTYSALYGVAMMVGAAGGGMIGSRFILNPDTGILVVVAMMICVAPIFQLLAPDASSKDLPRQPFSMQMVTKNFVFPLRNCRDFYLALSGKLLFVLGTFAVTGYQLYILTDYMGASAIEAGSIIATMSLINLVTGLIFATISGPLSDKLGRRKIFVMGSALLVAVATLFPFFVARPWAMLVFAFLAGIGQGVYNSIDQALNYEVLPDPETQAKDLGILNMANTGGQIFGPAVTGAVVGITASYGPVFLVSAVILGLSATLIKPIRSVR